LIKIGTKFLLYNSLQMGQNSNSHFANAMTSSKAIAQPDLIELASSESINTNFSNLDSTHDLARDSALDSTKIDLESLDDTAAFLARHIGVSRAEVEQMLAAISYESIDRLIDATVPQNIRSKRPLDLPQPKEEYQLLKDLKVIASKNQVFRSYIGMGYANCITPPVIQRNILECPGWYTQYTPYQAEIAQGRLEALLNFQTMVCDLTAMEIANSSLLDEATAAAEAMTMIWGLRSKQVHDCDRFLVDRNCHPQTIAVLKTRAIPLGIKIVLADWQSYDLPDPISDPISDPTQLVFGALLQYPDTTGAVHDYQQFIEKLHSLGGLAIVAADLLSLTLLVPPGEFGADVVVGNSQRFGIPLGYGGPHAAFFATRDAYKRQIPGRIVGMSKDTQGNPALRLALQTREQHIRRDKATSNICTAQVLLAIMAGMYGVYHGSKGLKNIALRIHSLAVTLAKGLEDLGYKLDSHSYFDTLCVKVTNQQLEQIQSKARSLEINLRVFNEQFSRDSLGISLDETCTIKDVTEILSLFNDSQNSLPICEINHELAIPKSLQRQTTFLNHSVFHSYHSETELLRYIYRLQSKDLSLAQGMIPLGSCTMKLNATSEMLPVTWAEFGSLHPFVPLEQTKGYQILCLQLEDWLAEITGFAGVSLQPNAGSQGEYSGLLVIRAYHQFRGEPHRQVCLIPQSAHGTNPASAVMAGMKVVAIACDQSGNIDIDDLRKKAELHQHQLAALMVTYPSTHGVFEAGIREICELVHYYGGQVYMDGANMNAQVGLCRPGDFGADVCHLNLHKTFCIPHGGGGPGVGPIAVGQHLVPFLPTTNIFDPEPSTQIGAVSAAPWGSASILTISWVYIALMGAKGLQTASAIAILNANYIAHRLAPHYPILYCGDNGLVAHECILDLRQLKITAGIEVDDIAKRLMDYGYHAPTVSWPVAGTMMVEPTESESKNELDRFCDAMIAIREEISEIEQGKMDKQDNPLKNAPHTAEVLLADDWNHPYSRNIAAYPAPWSKSQKFWVPVSRIDNAYGDRNLVCSCLPLEAYL
jgi:glycine dehydrogenase